MVLGQRFDYLYRGKDGTVMAKTGKLATSTKRAPAHVQVKNPIINRWVKLDTKTGRIVNTKKSEGPYKNVPRK
jgi:hypothetical protein